MIDETIRYDADYTIELSSLVKDLTYATVKYRDHALFTTYSFLPDIAKELAIRGILKDKKVNGYHEKVGN